MQLYRAVPPSLQLTSRKYVRATGLSRIDIERTDAAIGLLAQNGVVDLMDYFFVELDG